MKTRCAVPLTTFGPPLNRNSKEMAANTHIRRPQRQINQSEGLIPPPSTVNPSLEKEAVNLNKKEEMRG